MRARAALPVPLPLLASLRPRAGSVYPSRPDACFLPPPPPRNDLLLTRNSCPCVAPHTSPGSPGGTGGWSRCITTRLPKQQAILRAPARPVPPCPALTRARASDARAREGLLASSIASFRVRLSVVVAPRRHPEGKHTCRLRQCPYS